MDELSDSQSTRPSNSRPTTPLSPSTRPHPTSTRVRTTSDPTSSSDPSITRSRSHGYSGSDSESDHFAVPSKATHILGLVPGTLIHARACLENARDEARRLADITPATTAWTDQDVGEKKGGSGRMNRARKALSIAMPTSAVSAKNAAGAGVKVPSVVLCLGGEEEESKRERRRRVADGVLHWQKEVARLEQENQGTMVSAGGGLGRKGTRKVRR